MLLHFFNLEKINGQFCAFRGGFKFFDNRGNTFGLHGRCWRIAERPNVISHGHGYTKRNKLRGGAVCGADYPSRFVAAMIFCEAYFFAHRLKEIVYSQSRRKISGRSTKPSLSLW